MSVQPATHEEIQIDDDEVEEEEEDEDEEEDAEDEDFEDSEEVTHGRSSGRGLTLKTLLKEGVLAPGEGHMTINYLVRLPLRDTHIHSLAPGLIHAQCWPPIDTLAGTLYVPCWPEWSLYHSIHC